MDLKSGRYTMHCHFTCIFSQEAASAIGLGRLSLHECAIQFHGLGSVVLGVGAMVVSAALSEPWLRFTTGRDVALTQCAGICHPLHVHVGGLRNNQRTTAD